jgi:hypothetical protein
MRSRSRRRSMGRRRPGGMDATHATFYDAHGYLVGYIDRHVNWLQYALKIRAYTPRGSRYGGIEI